MNAVNMHKVWLILVATAASILPITGCAASNSLSTKSVECFLPTASAALKRNGDRHLLVIMLTNHSNSILKFDNWVMADQMIQLSVTTRSGEHLQRFVASETPGFQDLALELGETRSWTYNIESSFPELRKAISVEQARLTWEVKISPIDATCSMNVSGAVDLE